MSDTPADPFPSGDVIIWASPYGKNDSCGDTRENSCDVLTAIAIAPSNATVLLLSGTYYIFEPLLVKNRSIILQAEEIGKVTFTSDSEGQRFPGRFVLTLESTWPLYEVSYLRGISWQTFFGTPIKIVGGRYIKVVVEDSSFTQNGPDYDFVPLQGGAILAAGGFECRNCLFEGNLVSSASGASGGAIAIEVPCNVSGFNIAIFSSNFKGTQIEHRAGMRIL